MNWKDIGEAVGKFAPTLGTLLGGPVGAGIGSLISAALGTQNTPDAVQQALTADPQAATKILALTNTHSEELQKLQNQHDEAMRQADSADLATVNQTMREEVSKRVFGWRDLWGWVSGICFGFVCILAGWIVVDGLYLNHAEYMDKIPQVMGAFIPLFGISSAVLGVITGIESHHAGVTDRLNAGEKRGT